MTNEESRAITETAKFGQELVKAGGATGGYFAKILGDGPSDLVGWVLGDSLHEKRIRNRARLKQETEAYLLKIDETRLSEPSPSMLLPLFEAAVDCRDELRRLWAALLANAFIDGGKKIRIIYFEIVRKLEPIDAIVMEIYAVPRGQRAVVGAAHTEQRGWVFNSAKEKGIDEIEFKISEQSLDDLGCIVKEQGILSPLGNGLMSALQVV